MGSYAAVLFDVDGTLLDSGEYIFRAFEHVIEQRRFPARSRAELAAVVGMSLKECYRVLTPSDDLDTLCDEHRSFQRSRLEPPGLFKNTLPTLQALSRLGVRMAAVTNRSRTSSVATLQHTGIAGFFGAIVSAEDVALLKPHAEPVLKALEALGIPPAQAVMVGDTDADIGAGRNAGTLTVGVTYGFHGEKVREYHPDCVISDIAELLPLMTRDGRTFSPAAGP